ncbi:hypothetical protein [Mycobacterium sp. MMS18-G62]
MRRILRYLTPLIAAAGAAAALGAAPAAIADTTLPSCIGVGGNDVTGGATECATPGNVQLNATPPEPDYPYPWDDEFYGPALIIGGGGGGHGGGGR